MRRGFARLTWLPVFVIGAVAVAVTFPYCSRTHCGPWISPARLDLRSGVEVVAVDGCLEARLLPVPRYNIGLVDGKPGDLADLKPDCVLTRTDLRHCDWRG